MMAGEARSVWPIGMVRLSLYAYVDDESEHVVLGRFLDQLETVPLWSTWCESVGRTDRTLPVASVLVLPRLTHRKLRGGESLAAQVAGYLAEGTLGSVAVSAEELDPSGHPLRHRTYYAGVHTTRLGGEGVEDSWMGMAMTLRVPEFDDGVPAQWLTGAIDFLAPAVAATNTKYGLLSCDASDGRSVAGDWYSSRFFEGDPEPATLPGFAPILVVPERVLVRLGGLRSVQASGLVHRIEPIDYLDGTHGALLQLGADHHDYLDRLPEWITFAAPALHPGWSTEEPDPADDSNEDEPT
jgi:hypothetical protein